MTYKESTVSELAATEVACLIDVREPDEYSSGHVPGAVNVPLGTLADGLDSIPREGTVHVICQAGGRSASACEFLSRRPEFEGVTFVNVAGGTGGWIIEGNEVVGGSSPR